MSNVCVIGGGAAGIAAARHLIPLGYQVTVYEQMSQVGGTWLYDPTINKHSVMYEVMKTNLPKDVMSYHDKPFNKELTSFMNHQDVLSYIIEAAEGLNILVNHEVTSCVRENDKWKVTVQSDTDTKTQLFDAIFVCNGHHFTPQITFNHENFKGKFLHSRDYRRSADFAGQRVAVIGAANSGIDIALQLAETAEKVYLIGKKTIYKDLPEKVEQVPHVLKETTEDGFTLDNGSKLDKIDSIIACTGYRFKFPFFSEDIVQLKANGLWVSPLYEHVVHAKYPTSLFFIGINRVALTLPLFEYHVAFATAFLTGKVKKSEEELLGFEEERLQWLKEHNMDERAFHYMHNYQWEYFDKLAKIGQFEPIRNMKVLENIYRFVAEQRNLDVTGYKEINIDVDEDNNVIHVRK